MIRFGKQRRSFQAIALALGVLAASTAVTSSAARPSVPRIETDVSLEVKGSQLVGKILAQNVCQEGNTAAVHDGEEFYAFGVPPANRKGKFRLPLANFEHGSAYAKTTRASVYRNDGSGERIAICKGGGRSNPVALP